MKPSAVNIPSGSEQYRLFVESYKPKIRPEGQLERMVKAFRIDVQFLSQFEIFRSILKKSQIDWGTSILRHLHDRGAFKEDLGEEDERCILELYKRHTRLFRVGRFDEHYLDSIEDIALFFVHLDVKSIWLAGAYRELTDAHIDLVISTIGKTMSTPMGHSMKALTLALTAEINQIQRVYTMYERDVSDSLVKDLQYGGILTGMPTGRKNRLASPKG